MRVKKNNIKDCGIGYKIFGFFDIIIMLIVIAVMLFPYLNVLAKALNDANDTMLGGITLYPRKFTLDNFKVLLDEQSIYSAFFVSITRVVAAVIAGVTVQFMTAYALSRPELKHKRFFNILFMIPMYISGGLIPQYILFSHIHILNTFWVYILPTCFTFYNVMIVRTYMEINIPNSLIEAGRVMGANEARIFTAIVFPLCKPILATIVLWIAVGAWNDWTSTLYYIQKPSLYTLQYILMQTIKESERMQSLIQAAVQNGENVTKLQNSMTVTPEAMVSAQVIIVTLPIIIVYPFVQKYFVQGITLGGVKE